MTLKSNMARTRFSILSVVALSLTLIPVSLATPARPASAATSPFADGAFEVVWTRNDQPVAANAAARSWTWGPAPLASGYEPYAEATDGSGKRLVQYFDKARMEINDTKLAPTDKWYITNGLLTVELISGRMQTGNNKFETKQPAAINIASDPGDENAPTYSSFGTVSNTSAGEHRQPDKSAGGYASEEINRRGDVKDNAAHKIAESKISYFEKATGHNVPKVFWDFLNSSGKVRSGVDNVTKPLLDPWVFAMGLPISDAYWATVQIGGKNQPVMIQAFERRVLTYAPQLAREWQVQMGNIGQHYFEWRYNGNGGPTKATKPAPSTPVYISIPMLGVITNVEHVGVDENNNMDIPADPYNVAWYKYGPIPGKQGNAVMDGHLDWYGIKEAVFFYLGKLKPGDRIYVRDDKGVDRAFSVTKQLVCPYNNCPVQEVFGPSSAVRLNLITCNGTFNRTQQNYDKRLVVFSEALQ